MVLRPVDEVLDEVEERAVCPVDVLEDENDRKRLGHALEEEPPGGEEVFLVGRAALLETEKMREARLHEAPLVRIGDVGIDGGAELRRRGDGVLVLEDPRAQAHHLRERPERDSLTVGEAAAAVPPGVRRQPVEVLLELPREAGLADAADAHHRDEMRSALLGGGVEELLDETQIAVAADERGLEGGGSDDAAAQPDHADGAPQRHGFGLPLQLVRPGVLVDDRRLRGPAGCLAHEHGARRGGRLHPRGGVDEIAGDHALALRAERHRRLAGQDARACREAGCTDLLAERHDGRDEVECGADGPLGVVFVRDRSPPDGHHRIADELLHRAAEALDDAPRVLEVAGEELPHLLGVSRLGERGEADEIGEEHRYEPPLRLRRLARACGRLRLEPGAALAAELRTRRVGRPHAARTHDCQLAAAFAAKFPAGLVRGSASRAPHARRIDPASGANERLVLDAVRLERVGAARPLTHSAYSSYVPSNHVTCESPSNARMCVATRSRNQRSWRDHDGAAGEVEQRLLERAQRVDVEVVRRLVEQQHVAARPEELREVDAVALAAREVGDRLLLVAAAEVEPARRTGAS